MARYIDMDGYRKLFDEEYKKTRKLISEGETHLDNLAEGFSEASRVIDRMPTVDVVPKSECEKWYHEYQVTKEELKQEKAYHKETEKLADRYCVELHTAKSEVAREIVEIINDRIDNIRARTPYGGRAQGKTLAVEKMRLLETLKVEIVKKYTEDKG